MNNKEDNARYHQSTKVFFNESRNTVTDRDEKGGATKHIK